MKISRIETIHLGDVSHLLFVRVHTDAGLIGHGETYYTPSAVRGFIHEFASPLLLGRAPLAVEQHWRTIYELCAKFGARGVELRGLSALDVALWDVLAPTAPGLGTALLPDLARRPDATLVESVPT